MESASAGPQRAPLLGAARGAFLLLVALLPWMKNGLEIGGLEAFPVDLLFILTMVLWAGALATGQARLRLHPAFGLLAVYMAAMALSTAFSADPATSAFKLLTQLYLLLLPVLAFNLVQTEGELKQLFRWWLIPAAAVGAYGLATVLLFPIFGWHSFLREPLHHFGTLPPGPYPRIELTFEYPAMLANYLGVSLMLLFVADGLGWISLRVMLIVTFAIVVSAFWALTPGFGGLLAMVCLWLWYGSRGERPALSRVALIGAAALIGLEVLVAAVTPVLHPTAPFLIHVPGLTAPVAPAVRLLVWIDSARNFLSSPLVGHGLGLDAAHVLYQAPENSQADYVGDAHNLVLSIAAQCGLVGVAAVAAIIGYVLRLAHCSAQRRSDPLLFGLSIAWLAGFVVEGLVGSFEDARHLWILFGLVLVASRLDTDAEQPPKSY